MSDGYAAWQASLRGDMNFHTKLSQARYEVAEAACTWMAATVRHQGIVAAGEALKAAVRHYLALQTTEPDPEPPQKPPTQAAYEVYCDDKLVGHVLGPPDGKGVAVPPWMISAPGNYEVRPAGPDVKLADMTGEPMRFEMRPPEPPPMDEQEGYRRYVRLLEYLQAIQIMAAPGEGQASADIIHTVVSGWLKAERADRWDPARPVWSRHKVLGSDGEFHLSECMLVEHPATDYSCTCRDYEP